MDLVQIMVTAALYLACKVEEQPRSLSRVTQAVYSNAHSGYTEALKLTMKQVITGSCDYMALSED